MSQIKACAENDKHVFCEKPIATGVAETIEAINACTAAGVKLMTALQRRFDPNFARVKVAIENGEVGNVIQVCDQTIGIIVTISCAVTNLVGLELRMWRTRSGLV